MKANPSAPQRAAAARTLLIVATATAFLFGAGVALTLHRRAAPESDRGLPVQPNLAGKSADLRQRLTDLQARAAAKPNAPDTIAELGRLYHANGFAVEAEACWRLLLVPQPNEAHWPYFLADLRRTASDEVGFQHWLEKTVELAPNYAPAWLQLGDLAFKRGAFDAAEHAYRRRLECVPRDSYAAFGLARITLQRGQRAAGKRAIEELIRSSPEFPSAHNFYAEILDQENDTQGAANQRWLGTVAGRFRAAEDPWIEELRAFCYDADQLIVWGEIDFQTKHGDHGRALLERAVRFGPDNPRAYEKLGEFYLEEGEAEKAREVLERGRRLPGASENLFIALCGAYEALKRPTDALRVADDALALAPDSANLHGARGLALASSNRFEDALAAFHAAMAHAPGSPDVVTNFAIVLLQSGRRDEAVVQLKRALELQPRYSKALVTLSQLELEAGNSQEAVQYIFPFFQQFPGSRTARDLMTRLYVSFALEAGRRGESTGVEQACREGLAIVPEAAELYGLLGTNYVHENRPNDALEAFEAAQRLKPNDPRVVLSLGALYQTLGRFAEARRLLTEGEQAARLRGDMETAAKLNEQLQRLPP